MSNNFKDDVFVCTDCKGACHRIVKTLNRNDSSGYQVYVECVHCGKATHIAALAPNAAADMQASSVLSLCLSMGQACKAAAMMKMEQGDRVGAIRYSRSAAAIETYVDKTDPTKLANHGVLLVEALADAPNLHYEIHDHFNKWVRK